MIRVLHVVTYMGRGGLETMIMNYYRNLDRSRIQFDFLVHREFKADYEDEILQLGGKIYRMPVLNPVSPSYHQALNRFFKEHPYDIVHSHLDCLSVYPLHAAYKNGVKIRIAHAHNKSQDKNLKYILKYLSMKRTPRYATNLFACSKEAGDWMFSGREFRVMSNAIVAEDYRYSLETRKRMREQLGIKDELVIGNVARFHPQKNHKFLIDVFSCIVKERPDAKLLLVGGGDGESSLRKKVEDLDLKDQVMFLGVRSDIPELLQAMDLFVFPSLYEGLGIAALEAQAAGLPCFLSDGVPKECAVTEQVTYLSLEQSAHQWANAILKVVSQNRDTEANINAIKENGYDIQKNAEWLEKFYINRSEENVRSH